jgi:hypothetical protein
MISRNNFACANWAKEQSLPTASQQVNALADFSASVSAHERPINRDQLLQEAG